MKSVRSNRVFLVSDVTFCVPYFVSRSLFISAMILLSVFSVAAQDDGNSMPDDVAPPPLKLISKEEKDQLSAEPGIKDRTNLYLVFMEDRLKKAEDFSTRESFGDALSQFGIYQGLLENMMDFLGGENKNNKVLGGFKKLEITLRAHNIRIETVRRTLPFKYAFHIIKLQKFIRKSRAEAAESLFSDSVVPAAVEKKPQ